MTIIYHHTGNDLALVSLLTNIQPQLSEDDDIYIIDSTQEKTGVKISALYGTSKSYIFVEVGEYSRYDAVKYGLESMVENKQDGALVLGNVLVPQNFISNLKRACNHYTDYDLLVPEIHYIIYDVMDTNFRWNSRILKIPRVEQTNFLPAECFYIRENVIEGYFHNKVAKMKAGKLLDELVCVFP